MVPECVGDILKYSVRNRIVVILLHLFFRSLVTGDQVLLGNYNRL